jgi:broad specificity phosphatase PhoE
MILFIAIICLLVLFDIFIMVFMQPRRFYFVRHGETILNAKKIRQGEEGGLSEKGQHQAERVGQALKDLHIGRIISSPYERARETTDIINKYLNVPVSYSPLLVERRNPKEIIGKSTDDPQVREIVDQMDLAYHADDFRVSDEENFMDLKGRAAKCLTFLSHDRAPQTIVVTHHNFLKMLIAYLLYRKQLSAKEFVKLAFFNISDNAGITICEYHPLKRWSRTRGWIVVSYNQQP